MSTLSQAEQKEAPLYTWGRIQVYLDAQKKQNRRLASLMKKLEKDLLKLQIESYKL